MLPTSISPSLFGDEHCPVLGDDWGGDSYDSQACLYHFRMSPKHDLGSFSCISHLPNHLFLSSDGPAHIRSALVA